MDSLLKNNPTSKFIKITIKSLMKKKIYGSKEQAFPTHNKIKQTT